MIVTSFISGNRKTWFVSSRNVSFESILEFLAQKEGSANDVVLFYNGRSLYQGSIVPSDANVTATLRLRGGKGGFGSMLRAIGAQIEKTTNREACRDLSGRRLRDINEEKRLKEFLSKKVDKEREALERKKKKLEELKDGTKHIFEDETYFQQREKREKDLYDSMDKAFAPRGESSGIKRSKPCPDTVRIKKSRLCNDLDDSSDESEDEAGQNDEKSIPTENKTKMTDFDKLDSQVESLTSASKGVLPSI